MDRNYKKIRDHSLIDWNSNENKLDFFSQISFLLAKKKKIILFLGLFWRKKKFETFFKNKCIFQNITLARWKPAIKMYLWKCCQESSVLFWLNDWKSRKEKFIFLAFLLILCRYYRSENGHLNLELVVYWNVDKI